MMHPARVGIKFGPLAGGGEVEHARQDLVPHMHFFRCDPDGRVTDLWHVWKTLALARQLGAPAPDLRVGAPA